jgi:hypothetical protein
MELWINAVNIWYTSVETEISTLRPGLEVRADSNTCLFLPTYAYAGKVTCIFVLCSIPSPHPHSSEVDLNESLKLPSPLRPRARPSFKRSIVNDFSDQSAPTRSTVNGNRRPPLLQRLSWGHSRVRRREKWQGIRDLCYKAHSETVSCSAINVPSQP